MSERRKTYYVTECHLTRTANSCYYSKPWLGRFVPALTLENYKLYAGSDRRGTIVRLFLMYCCQSHILTHGITSHHLRAGMILPRRVRLVTTYNRNVTLTSPLQFKLLFVCEIVYYIRLSRHDTSSTFLFIFTNIQW